jgi:tetratricopeptide (TPR) repeat protein
MTRRGGVCLLVMLAGAAPAGAAEMQQSTTAPCSPIQSGNGNTFICYGVDQRAMDRLNELLDRKDLDLNQKTAEANEFARKYNEVNAQLEEAKKELAALNEEATPLLLKRAQDLLHEGKFEDLAQALNELGNLYVGVGRYANAEVVYEEAATLQLELAGTFSPGYARTLNNLGKVYVATGRFDEGKARYLKAVQIWRELAAQNLGEYGRDLTETLNNLTKASEAEALATSKAPAKKRGAASSACLSCSPELRRLVQRKCSSRPPARAAQFRAATTITSPAILG